MGLIQVKTGYGYLKDINGHVIARAILPKGAHLIKNDYEYVEVETRAKLDLIEVYKNPANTQQAEYEAKIQTKMRSMAIDELKAAGDLPADYKDK